MPTSTLGAIPVSPYPIQPTYKSPYETNILELINFFHELLTNYFHFSEPQRGERDWDDIFAGERYGYLSPPAYDSDQSYPGSKVHKIFRFTMLLREAFETELEATMQAGAIAMRIEHGLFEIKQMFPHDFGMVWDVLNEGQIEPYIMASIKKPTLWTVELICRPTLRCVVRDLFTGEHEQPPMPKR